VNCLVIWFGLSLKKIFNGGGYHPHWLGLRLLPGLRDRFDIFRAFFIFFVYFLPLIMLIYVQLLVSYASYS
jgi:hypothetical protein